MKQKYCLMAVAMALFLSGDWVFTASCEARLFSVQPRALVERDLYLLTDTVQFTADITGGVPPYDFFWQEGDGASTSREQFPLIIFGSYGSRTISVTVTDGTGQVATGSITLEVILGYAPGGARGRILSKTGAPVSGAEIFIDSTLVGISLSTGDYFLQSLPGTLTMEINVSGFIPFAKEFPIDPFVMNMVDITLDKENAVKDAPTLQLVTSWETISLLWDSLPQYDGYTLYYAPYPNADYIGSVDLGGAAGLTATLWQGAAFYVAVVGYNTTGSGPYSNIGIFQMDAF